MGRPFQRSSRFIVLSALLGYVSPVLAQQAAPQAPLLTLRTGPVIYGTGDDANCAYLPAIAGGLQMRTQGVWFLAASGDLYQTAPNFACTLMLPLVVYGEDRYAEEFAGAVFSMSPRLALHAGRALRLREHRWEPAVGAGLLYSASMDGDAREWRPWVGSSVAIARQGSRFAVRAEYGWHRVPVRHEIHRWPEPGQPPVYLETRRFERWRGLGQVAVQVLW